MKEYNISLPNAPDHHHILQRYGLTPDARLNHGMEATVYAYGSDAVLKLYGGSSTRMHTLQTLQAFYDTLDRGRVPYALPRIIRVVQEDMLIVTIEPRLPGTPLDARLAGLTAQIEPIMHRYLDAVLALGELPAPPDLERYQLFDPHSLSACTQGDWHAFLKRSLAHALTQTATYLQRDLAHFAARMQQLDAILSCPYEGTYRLIHGDLFPGNLLVNETNDITALLDFGLFSMYGDPMFDIATSWVLFDMYDTLGIAARPRFLALLLERLGQHRRGRLYRYVLIYSILSANTYAADCSDGHYQWCVANLNHADYWKALE